MYSMGKTSRKKAQSANASGTKSLPNLMSMEEALAALIQRNEELISLNQSKDEFIAITSHQLRTPATGVKQYLGLLLEGYADPLTPSQKTFIEKAYENNERQLHIVDDILKIAQLDLDKIRLNPEVYDLNILLQGSVESLQGKFSSKGQKIKFHASNESILALIDVEEVRLVIENLLENASNYSPEGKSISVSLKSTKNGDAKIDIKDQGVGIEKQDIAKLFQKFSRINNPLSNAVNGTGLGLYFSKKIIELHRGKVMVRSTPGKSTTFTILLPQTK
jgi:two-component system phosphate regulon sensor histidine kinase PhoR